MALSFGRKKGEATNEADNPTSNGTHGAKPAAPANSVRSGAGRGDEAIDESWFDTLAEEAAANPLPSTPATPQSNFSVPASAPEPDFSVFDTDDAEDFGDFGTQVDIPEPTAASPANSSVFVDPALSGAPSSDASTPFDLPPVTAPAADAPAKKGGGLKKVLPALLVLIIVGGGGAFWMSQKGSNDEDDGGLSGSSGMPMTQPTGAMPTGAAPTGAAPATSPPSASADPKVKAQLKKLWDEGLALRKENKIAAAKAKWGAAVRLARSHPGNEKSADMIQQAIDKLK